MKKQLVEFLNEQDTE